MSTNFLEKYISPATRAVPPHGRSESDQALEPLVERSDRQADEFGEDHGCFGYLRGVKERAMMLELHKRNGNIRAIPYTWIESIDYDPSDGITLRCSVAIIRITGRNLHLTTPHTDPRPDLQAVSIFSALCRHRVPWVKEASKADLTAYSSVTTIINQIEW